MKYRFIEENRSGFVVEKMCLALKVSKSGYYAWKGRGKSRRELENEELETTNTKTCFLLHYKLIYVNRLCHGNVWLLVFREVHR